MSAFMVWGSSYKDSTFKNIRTFTNIQVSGGALSLQKINDTLVEITSDDTILQHNPAVKSSGGSVLLSFGRNCFRAIYYTDNYGNKIGSRGIYIKESAAGIKTMVLGVGKDNWSNSDAMGTIDYLDFAGNQIGVNAVCWTTKSGAGDIKIMPVSIDRSCDSCCTALVRADTHTIANSYPQSFFNSMALNRDSSLSVVYLQDNATTLILKRYRIREEGKILEMFTDSAVVVTGSPIKIYNPIVAVDSSENHLVAWRLGNSDAEKRKLFISVLDNNLKVLKGADLLMVRENVLSSTSIGKFGKEMDAYSFQDKQFIIVYGSNDSVFYSMVQAGGDTAFIDISQDTSVVLSPEGRWPRISGSHHSMIIAWVGRHSTGNRCIEAVTCTTGSGFKLDDKNMWLSDTARNIDWSPFYYNNIGLAMDKAGNILTSYDYRTEQNINLSVWSKSSVFELTGTCSSGICSLASVTPVPLNPDDSIVLDNFALDFNTKTKTLVFKMRFGSTQDVNNYSNWEDILSPGFSYKGEHEYFQYVVDMVTDNKAVSPELYSFSFDYNVKPRAANVDSVLATAHKTGPFNHGDSIRMFCRKPARVYYSCTDPDDKTLFSFEVEQSRIVNAVSAARISPGAYAGDSIDIPPYTNTAVDSIKIRGIDSDLWQGEWSAFYISAVNFIPLHSIEYDSLGSNVRISSGETLTIYNNDSLSIYFTPLDSNDDSLNYTYFVDGDVIDNKTTAQNQMITIKHPAVDVDNRFDTLILRTADPEAAVSGTIFVEVRNSPVIDSIRVSGRIMPVTDSITILALDIGSSAKCTVWVTDKDVSFGDMMNIEWLYNSTNLLTTGNTCEFTSTNELKHVLVTVTDMFGLTDTARLLFKFPQIDTATQDFVLSKLKLADSIMVMIGRDILEIPFPITNKGSDTLRIDSMRIKSRDKSWFITNPETLNVAPNSTDTIKLLFFAKSADFSGDSFKNDTMMIYSNDAFSSVMELPVKIKYYDLPRLASTNLSLVSDLEPVDTIPFNAPIRLIFSEPVNLPAVLSACTLYSVNDSVSTGSMASAIIPFSLYRIDNNITFMSPPQ
ncbi:MAG: hypothetical protein ABIA63_12455, partial [bacterium]